jgi:hypothetical protein
VEYSLSASLMIVLIAMLTGISGLAALIALFGVNAAMILFGLAMEQANRPGAPVNWRPFVYGCIAGAVPWIAIAVQIGYSESQTGNVPGFVYGSSSRCSCSSTASPPTWRSSTAARARGGNTSSASTATCS